MDKIKFKKLFMTFIKFSHKPSQSFSVLQSDCVVQGSSNASDRTMAFQLHHFLLLCFLQKFLFQCIVATVDSKRNVHATSTVFSDWTCEEAVRHINSLINHLRFNAREFAHAIDASVRCQPLEDAAHDVNAKRKMFYIRIIKEEFVFSHKRGWCVSNGIILQCGRII